MFGPAHTPGRRERSTACGLCVAAVVVLACATWGADDPWPEYQRTASRIGHTSTVGPRTPTIAWRLLADPSSPLLTGSRSQVVMDSNGLVYAAHIKGIAAVDPRTHSVVQQIYDYWGVDASPSLAQGRILFGTPGDMFHCVDTTTWEE
ncbi:MAG: hypothetical protein AB1716_16050, partial [Planctomycetota bacterium]